MTNTKQDKIQEIKNIIKKQLDTHKNKNNKTNEKNNLDELKKALKNHSDVIFGTFELTELIDSSTSYGEGTISKNELYYGYYFAYDSDQNVETIKVRILLTYNGIINSKNIYNTDLSVRVFSNRNESYEGINPVVLFQTNMVVKIDALGYLLLNEHDSGSYSIYETSTLTIGLYPNTVSDLTMYYGIKYIDFFVFTKLL